MNVAVLVSGHGRGTNAQALMDASAKPGCPFRVCVVISATPGHGALDRAIRAGVSSEVIDACALGEGFETALLDALRRYAVEAVALAGFMRRLSPEFVARYPNRILNVHPALLPSFGGRGMYGERVHKAVLAHGVKVTGCTVHFVDAEYDHGPIILQKAVAVMEDDTPKTLGIRVLVHEHSAYVEALTLLAQGRLAVIGRRVRQIPPGVFTVMGEWGSPQLPDDPGLLEACYAIRTEVFVREQNVPVELELDEHDATAWHFLLFVDGVPMATARLFNKNGAAKIGRVAVRQCARGTGLGRRIMDVAVNAARELRLEPVILDAQVQVIPFYEKLGFVAEGPVFDDAGIPHRRMTLKRQEGG